MRIEFLKEWMKYRIGDTTTDVAPGVADVLFMRRIARPAPEATAPESLGGQTQAEQPAPRISRRK
jgi:hypothetical protein